ncbi:MAG: beta strand repeat-containing protein, partial [Betaproteobacteria bacterium]
MTVYPKKMSRQSNQRINQLGHLLLQVGALVRRGGTFCTMIASAAKAGRYALLACAFTAFTTFTTLFGATAQAQVTMTGLQVASPIFNGQPATFGVSFTNPPGSSKTVSFTYTFPAGVVIAATPGVQNNCDPIDPNAPSGSFEANPGGSTLTVTNFIVGNGFVFCRMNVKVTSATPATYSLPVSALTATSGFTISGTAPGVSLVVNGRPTLTKAFSPTTIGVGSPSTLTFTITNPASFGAASGLTFTDTFPTGMVIAATPNVVNSCGGSPTITATAGAGSIVVGGGVNAAAGPSTCTVTVQVTSQTAGFYLNGAGQMATSTNLFNGVTNQILTVTRAGLTAAFNPASIGQGETSTLTFTLTNGAGNPAQSGINFTNSLPTGVTVAASPSIASTCPSGVGAVAATGGASSITVTGASMSAGQATCTISVPVTSRVVGTYTNTAARFSSLARVTNNVVDTTLTVTAQPTLTKTIRSTASNLFGGVGLNANLRWTIVLPSGFSTISGISFNDTLPTGMVIATPLAIEADCNSPTVTATAGGTTIAVSDVLAIAGRTCGITVQVVPAIEAPATYPSLASTIANLTSTIFNVSVDETYQVTQAGLTALFSPATIAQGDTSTLTYTLTNGTGNPAQSGINFTNSLPSGVTVAASPAVSNTCGGSPTIAAGAGAGSITVTGASIGQWAGTCTISVAVTSSVAGTFTNDTSRFASVARVTNAVNTTLTVTPKVSLFMSFVPTFVAKSQPARLQFDLVNPSVSAGGSNQTGVGFTNNLPTGVVVANPPAVSNSCGGTVTAGAGGTTIALAGVSMLAGTGCILSVAVTSATAGVYQNTPQSITAVTSNVFNNTTTQTLTVWEAPTASVSFAATNLALNGTTTMTISVTNPSPNTVAMTGVGFTNNYPTGLTGATTATITGT